MDQYDTRYMPVSEVRAAQEAGYLTLAEAKVIVKGYFPQLRELDRARQLVKETG